jgi:hypothetical protein
LFSCRTCGRALTSSSVRRREASYLNRKDTLVALGPDTIEQCCHQNGIWCFYMYVATKSHVLLLYVCCHQNHMRWSCVLDYKFKKWKNFTFPLPLCKWSCVQNLTWFREGQKNHPLTKTCLSD